MRENSETAGARWIAAAREDLSLARHAAAGGFHAGACFHAQQAAEKAVHYGRGAIERSVMAEESAFSDPEKRLRSPGGTPN